MRSTFEEEFGATPSDSPASLWPRVLVGAIAVLRLGRRFLWPTLVLKYSDAMNADELLNPEALQQYYTTAAFAALPYLVLFACSGGRTSLTAALRLVVTLIVLEIFGIYFMSLAIITVAQAMPNLDRLLAIAVRIFYVLLAVGLAFPAIRARRGEEVLPFGRWLGMGSDGERISGKEAGRLALRFALPCYLTMVAIYLARPSALIYAATFGAIPYWAYVQISKISRRSDLIVCTGLLYGAIDVVYRGQFSQFSTVGDWLDSVILFNVVVIPILGGLIVLGSFLGGWLVSRTIAALFARRFSVGMRVQLLCTCYLILAFYVFGGITVDSMSGFNFRFGERSRRPRVELNDGRVQRVAYSKEEYYGKVDQTEPKGFHGDRAVEYSPRTKHTVSEGDYDGDGVVETYRMTSTELRREEPTGTIDWEINLPRQFRGSGRFSWRAVGDDDTFFLVVDRRVPMGQEVRIWAEDGTERTRFISGVRPQYSKIVDWPAPDHWFFVEDLEWLEFRTFDGELVWEEKLALPRKIRKEVQYGPMLARSVQFRGAARPYLVLIYSNRFTDMGYVLIYDPEKQAVLQERIPEVSRAWRLDRDDGSQTVVVSCVNGAAYHYELSPDDS